MILGDGGKITAHSHSPFDNESSLVKSNRHSHFGKKNKKEKQNKTKETKQTNK